MPFSGFKVGEQSLDHEQVANAGLVTPQIAAEPVIGDGARRDDPADLGNVDPAGCDGR